MLSPNPKPKLLLVNMPWATGHRPSISLAILRALALEEGLSVQTFYANLDMAALIGFKAAAHFSDERPLYGLSEHYFAVDMFGKEALASDEFLESLRQVMLTGKEEWQKPFTDMDHLKHFRDDVIPPFMDSCIKRVLEISPDIVGFSATFNQVMGSLALAKRIKAVRPDIQIIAGGACFDDEMGREYHRTLPDVLDHVFMGEAEESFLEYIRRFKEGRSTRGIPGVTTYVEGKIELLPGRPLQDMNASPAPDYDDFFTEKDRVAAATGKIFNVEHFPFESSRGCWWGQKNHCVFCGINNDLMSFRAKDVDRVLEDIVMMSARYGAVKFTATDWIISRWHCDELFAKLKALGLDFEFFYEVRADMKKEQIMAMKEAGVGRVQPGIESFSTPLLKLMKKGTTAIRHIQFLRWCKEIGINALYNILAGFPGEDPVWYEDMVRLLPHIAHLQPPTHNVFPIEMHRFAPLFEEREKMGVERHGLRPDYSYNFPAGAGDAAKMAYFFVYTSNMLPKTEVRTPQLLEAFATWIQAHKDSKLPIYYYLIGAGFVQIHDTRGGQERFLHLADMHRDVVLLCDQLMGRRQLADQLRPLWGSAVDDGTLAGIVDELIKADILMAEGEHLLTLPIGHKPRSTAELREIVFGPAETAEPDGAREPVLERIEVVAKDRSPVYGAAVN